MARVRRGVAVRLLYMMTLAAMTCLVVVMYEGTLNMSGTWMFGAGILGLIIECIVTNKMTQGFDWKWINPATIIFSGNALASIWFIQLRTLAYSNQGLYVCVNNTALEQFRSLDVAVLSDWLDFCGCGHCNGAAEQLFVIMLLIGRYFLPRGVSFYNPDDKINAFLKSLAKTHYLLVIACNGADVLDIMAYSRYPGIQGNNYIIGVLLILFSTSMIQFCVDPLATLETKQSDIHIILETDLWSSLIILLSDDIPFMCMRLFLMVNYQAFSPFGTFFLFKNILCVAVTLHKSVMLWKGKDMEEIEDYVMAVPLPPEAHERSSSVMGTPDDLDDISDSSSVYSHEQAVRSRMEKGKPKNDWGDQSQWFENSKVELDREATKVSVESAQVSTGSAQALNSEDVEQGHGSNVSIRAVNYFTDLYAEDKEAALKRKKVGTQRVLTIPLGFVTIKGKIDFSGAFPKPKVRLIRSASADPDKRKKGGDDGDDGIEDKQADKSRENVDDAVDDIINAVDDDGDDEKEKKKKKKKSKDREKTDSAEENIEKEQQDTQDEDGDGGEKKKKKKKDKDRERERTQYDEEDAEGDERKHKKKKKKSKSSDHDADEGNEEKEKKKKKKKSKDRDREKDNDDD